MPTEPAQPLHPFLLNLRIVRQRHNELVVMVFHELCSRNAERPQAFSPDFLADHPALKSSAPAKACGAQEVQRYSQMP